MSRSVPWFSKLALALVTIGLACSPLAHAQQESVLFSFSGTNYNGGGGTDPLSGVIFDAKGNAYGPAFDGGFNFGGTIFELIPASNSTWKEKILHTFAQGSTKDGTMPDGGLIFDAAGNLYGTTLEGGAATLGTVFRLSPQPNGTWKESLLHVFGLSASDGINPSAELIFDSAGNLYGTTLGGGGANNAGIVFELSPTSSGEWRETILHTFNISDGASLQKGLVFDSHGNLFGSASNGGPFDGGVVFELAPARNGKWNYHIIQSFNFSNTSGFAPVFKPVFDSAGNLYGSNSWGGQHNYGTAFKLTPTTGDQWQFTVIHDFNNDGIDGFYPQSTFVLDQAGNLYSNSCEGGAFGAGLDLGGVVYELSPQADGSYSETILHNFGGLGGDGTCPLGDLVRDSSGNIFGTTSSGGSNNQGTVFEITP